MKEHEHSEERVVRFGPFELGLRSGELRRRGYRLRLPDKPFQALALLVERAGHVVSREELYARLWPAGTFVEFNDNLNATIKRLRNVLDDSAEHPRFIETVPRRGYRFVAHVEIVNDVVPVTQTPIRPRRPMVTIAAAALGIFVFATISFHWKPSLRHCLAVAAFTNSSGDPGRNFLASGLTDTVRTRLRRLSPARLDVISYAPAIGADYVLYGNLQRENTLVARLVDLHSGADVWTETFRLPLQETFVQHELARRTAATFSLGIPPASRSTDNVVAFEASMRGTAALRESRLAAAMQWFRTSLDNDPKYAPAYAGLAQSVLLLGKAGALPMQQAEAQARQAIDAGARLDPRNADFPRLQAALFSERDQENAERSYRRALELDPASPETHTEYALFLRERQPERALAEIKTAQYLDPTSAMVSACMGWVLMSTDNADGARAQLEAALRLDPHQPAAMRFLGMLEERSGHPREATAWFEKAATASGRKPFYVYRLGVAYVKAGREREVRNVLAELRMRARTEPIDPEYIRRLQSSLGG